MYNLMYDRGYWIVYDTYIYIHILYIYIMLYDTVNFYTIPHLKELIFGSSDLWGG